MIRRRKPGCNISDTDQRYCIRLVIIKNTQTGRYYGTITPNWFIIPDPRIKVFKNVDLAEKFIEELNLKNLVAEEMPLVPGLRFDR